ncbi:MAG: hypothetical protein WBP93_04785 [Pyrinomonadaceae bacterium]
MMKRKLFVFHSSFIIPTSSFLHPVYPVHPVNFLLRSFPVRDGENDEHGKGCEQQHMYEAALVKEHYSDEPD